jgi:flagellar hook-length control protein FliK
MIAGQVISSTDNSVGGDTPAASPGTSATPSFDLVLALESLAAPLTELTGQLNLEIGADGLDADEDGTDDGDSSDEPLAFLAGLLGATVRNVATPAGTPPAGTANVAAADPLLTTESGMQRAGATSATQNGPDSDAAVNRTGDLFAAVDALSATRADASSGTSDTAPQGTRAAEWLAHGVRHMTAASEQQVIATSVRDPRWADDFATRISLMVRGGESQASLQLSPVDLGPMDVSVTVRDGQASIHFGAAHSETRALIEASLPRLREMLAAQGFHLMDASVSQGFARQNRPEVPTGSQQAADPEIETRATRAVHVTGLLDLYA